MTDSARNSNAISSEPLWVPSQKQKESALLFDFMGKISKKTGRKIDNYADLWRWSVDFSEEFWDFLWDYCDVQGEKGGRVLDSNGGQMLGARFFPEGQINFAENNLRQRDKQTAIIFRNETGQERSLSYADLYEQVSLWQQAFIREGVREGDRVAAYMPNIPETIIAFLAAASLGAIWSSASPDFGVQGVIDRFGQIEPKILITADGYHYNGKVIDCLPKVKDVQPALKGLKKTVVIPFAGSSLKPEALPDAVSMADFTAGLKPKEVEFKRVDFNHPLFILFSSGTTGVPKCIVHGHGGTLLQHLKEHRLQTNIKPGDKVFYFTTCGWMMWNWLVTGLASGATLLLYDGSPFFSEGRVLWDFTSVHGCTLFGTSAKYIDALKSAGMNPGKTHDLSALRTVTSTGSPLVHESFDYIYKAIKPDVHLASISGGTDIVSCFMLGNPLSPVWRGEIQGPGLGMAVDVFDEEGQPATISAGELVCTKPFPSMPVSFWNDPERVKYKAAYFERFENIWVHGDWVEKTPHGGFIIHGRSDATLNPGGVRIGTAEIYRQVEQIEGVQESIAVGQDWEGDVRVILFVVLKKGWELDENLTKEIKTKIRNGASPRHVPAKIIAVSDIPRTKSGKITELAVRDVIHGRKIKNVEALANPDSLQLYKNLQELQG